MRLNRCRAPRLAFFFGERRKRSCGRRAAGCGLRTPIPLSPFSLLSRSVGRGRLLEEPAVVPHEAAGRYLLSPRAAEPSTREGERSAVMVSRRWGYIRIMTGTILGGVLGFYVMHRLETSYKEKAKERLIKYENEMKKREQRQQQQQQETG